MGSDVATDDKKSAKRGSRFSDKQIAHAVKDRRLVRFILLDGSQVYGFLMGADDYHWGVVKSDGTTVMVHKTAPLVEFTPTTLGDLDEDSEALIEPLLIPFRHNVMKTLFGQSPATT